MNASLRYATDFVLLIVVIGIVLFITTPPAGVEQDPGRQPHAETLAP